MGHQSVPQHAVDPVEQHEGIRKLLVFASCLTQKLQNCIYAHLPHREEIMSFWQAVRGHTD